MISFYFEGGNTCVFSPSVVLSPWRSGCYDNSQCGSCLIVNKVSSTCLHISWFCNIIWIDLSLIWRVRFVQINRHYLEQVCIHVKGDQIIQDVPTSYPARFRYSAHLRFMRYICYNEWKNISSFLLIKKTYIPLKFTLCAVTFCEFHSIITSHIPTSVN